MSRQQNRADLRLFDADGPSIVVDGRRYRFRNHCFDVPMEVGDGGEISIGPCIDCGFVVAIGPRTEGGAVDKVISGPLDCPANTWVKQ